MRVDPPKLNPHRPLEQACAGPTSTLILCSVESERTPRRANGVPGDEAAPSEPFGPARQSRRGVARVRECLYAASLESPDRVGLSCQGHGEWGFWTARSGGAWAEERC